MVTAQSVEKVSDGRGGWTEQYTNIDPFWAEFLEVSPTSNIIARVKDERVRAKLRCHLSVPKLKYRDKVIVEDEEYKIIGIDRPHQGAYQQYWLMSWNGE